jgi:hypothetical protein
MRTSQLPATLTLTGVPGAHFGGGITQSHQRGGDFLPPSTAFEVICLVDRSILARRDRLYSMNTALRWF